MRRWTMVALVVAALGSPMALTHSAAAGSATLDGSWGAMVHSVHYDSKRHHPRAEPPGHSWEQARMHDRARLTEAARREGWRIEPERTRHRAWHPGHGDHYGYDHYH